MHAVHDVSQVRKAMMRLNDVITLGFFPAVGLFRRSYGR
jgi:hypothetical protein